MRRVHRAVPILVLLLPVVLFGIALAAPRTAAATMTVTVNEGDCVQIGTVPSGSGSWSMTSSSTFEAVVTSSTGYSYGPDLGSSHQGPATNSNYFLTACNVCPAGAIQVTYQFPGSPDSNSPRTFAAQDYPATCASPGGFGFGGGIDDLPFAVQPVVGPLALIAALVALVVIVALPLPRGFGSAQIAPPLIPFPVQPPQPVPPPAPAPMAGPGPRLVPTPWIGVGHDVPVDAPPQFAITQYPPGYPYPPGTYARTTCPICGFPTLCPFTDGWFCTNLQCPGRTGNVTQFIQKQWHQP